MVKYFPRSICCPALRRVSFMQLGPPTQKVADACSRAFPGKDSPLLMFLLMVVEMRNAERTTAH